VVQVTATNDAGTGTASSAVTDVIAAAPPSNTVAPAITGIVGDGQTLTAAPGTWSGTARLSFAYQWQSCDQTGANCVDVAGATASTYQLGPGDVGTTLVVVLTAAHGAGSVSAVSPPSGVIAEPPANVSAPVLDGSAVVVETLSADEGSWSGTAPFTYSYQWEDCDGSGANCWAIAGATGASYHVPPWEAGESVSVIVTAANAGGSAGSIATASPTVPPTADPPAPVYFPSSFFAQPLPADTPLDPQSAAMTHELTDEAFGVAPSVSFNCRRSTYLNHPPGQRVATDWNAGEALRLGVAMPVTVTVAAVHRHRMGVVARRVRQRRVAH
jgi:hypothetical protein